MIRIFLFPSLTFISCFGILYAIDSPSFMLYDFYAQKMQTPLFTGFLTIGSFLLTLKTFILMKLRENLYDSPAYKKRLAEMRTINPAISHYRPLANLGYFLLYCVLGSLITAISQFSLGFIKHKIIAGICISLAAATLSLVFLAWWEIKKNLIFWFELLEDNDNDD